MRWTGLRLCGNSHHTIRMLRMMSTRLLLAAVAAAMPLTAAAQDKKAAAPADAPVSM